MNNEPMSLDFPADVEGHLGTDGRYYLVDVHRLFPAEREFMTSYAVLIPANPNVWISFEPINRSSGRYENHFSRQIEVGRRNKLLLKARWIGLDRTGFFKLPTRRLFYLQ